MMIDNVLTDFWVTPDSDGDIWLGLGETQKFLAVYVHSTY